MHRKTYQMASLCLAVPEQGQWLAIPARYRKLSDTPLSRQTYGLFCSRLVIGLAIFEKSGMKPTQENFEPHELWLVPFNP
jgi:hypothetical protein